MSHTIYLLLARVEQTGLGLRHSLPVFLVSRAGWAPCVLVQIREYEQVIIEDRVEKEKTRRRLEQDDLELKSVLKVGCAGSRRAWQGRHTAAAAHGGRTHTSRC